MTPEISTIIAQIRSQDPEFDRLYLAYKKQIADWSTEGLWKNEFVQGKTVLDWECGRGVFTAIFLEMGAQHVVGIDTWLDQDYADQVLAQLPNTTFNKMSIKEFRTATDNQFDLIFANTATEHLIDLPQQLIACWYLTGPDGLLYINHDNYYQPVGSHDHGFLFYNENNKIVFQGPECWSSAQKCEASEQFRQTIIQRYPWTWDKQIETLMDPNACSECPYYRRSRPWAHLIYQQDFRRIFPQVSFTTGYENSSLNKITTFQLKQYIIEAGFNIEHWMPHIVSNKPPTYLTKPPFNFHENELRTCTVAAVSRKFQTGAYRTGQLNSISELPPDPDQLALNRENDFDPLQSQDFVTRHFIKITLRNLSDIVRNPARLKKKLQNWINYRVIGKKG